MTLAHPPLSLHGLSEREVREQHAQGHVNHAPVIATRSYVRILRENVFTVINTGLFALGIGLLLLGRPFDALISAGVVVINAVASSAQELRAKHQLDQIALLHRPHAVVVRDGRARPSAPEAIVLGDGIKAAAGDYILADGSLLDGRIEVDESQLTGEADLLTKRAGASVSSGSTVASGSAVYVAEKIGADSLLNEMTAKARAFRRVTTPLQRDVNILVRIFLLTIVYLEVLVFGNALIARTGVLVAVQNAALVAGLIPDGLFVTISVAYAISAVRLLRFGVLVQQSNAIESLNHVDTLAIDKTGTLTAGIPTPLIALWAHGGAPATGNVLRRLLQFMLPPTLLAGLIGVPLFFAASALAPAAGAIAAAQTALLTFLVLSGLLVVFAEPPTRWWAVVAPHRRDWRPTVAALAALAFYVVILIVPTFRALATLTLLNGATLALVLGCTLVWTVVVRLIWQHDVLARFVHK